MEGNSKLGTGMQGKSKLSIGTLLSYGVGAVGEGIGYNVFFSFVPQSPNQLSPQTPSQLFYPYLAGDGSAS